MATQGSVEEVIGDDVGGVDDFDVAGSSVQDEVRHTSKWARMRSRSRCASVRRNATSTLPSASPSSAVANRTAPFRAQ